MYTQKIQVNPEVKLLIPPKDQSFEEESKESKKPILWIRKKTLELTKKKSIKKTVFEDLKRHVHDVIKV